MEEALRMNQSYGCNCKKIMVASIRNGYFEGWAFISMWIVFKRKIGGGSMGSELRILSPTSPTLSDMDLFGVRCPSSRVIRQFVVLFANKN